MTTKPTAAQIDAGVKAGRAMIEKENSFESSQIPDSALTVFVSEIETAVLNSPAANPVPDGCTAGRTALENYSWFASMAVTDDELTEFVTDIEAAAKAAS